MLCYNTPQHTPNKSVRRVPSFQSFLKMGGAYGMVRRIIQGWNHPFTINQLKIAFHRRHPELLLGDYQIDDMLAFMAERRLLIQLADGSYQRPREVE